MDDPSTRTLFLPDRLDNCKMTVVGLPDICSFHSTCLLVLSSESRYVLMVLPQCYSVWLRIS